MNIWEIICFIIRVYCIRPIIRIVIYLLSGLSGSTAQQRDETAQIITDHSHLKRSTQEHIDDIYDICEVLADIVIKHSIKITPIAGTALGIVRHDNGMMPHDDDADFAVSAEFVGGNRWLGSWFYYHFFNHNPKVGKLYELECEFNRRGVSVRPAPLGAQLYPMQYNGYVNSSADTAGELFPYVDLFPICRYGNYYRYAEITADCMWGNEQIYHEDWNNLTTTKFGHITIPSLPIDGLKRLLDKCYPGWAEFAWLTYDYVNGKEINDNIKVDLRNNPIPPVFHTYFNEKEMAYKMVESNDIVHNIVVKCWTKYEVNVKLQFSVIYDFVVICRLKCESLYIKYGIKNVQVNWEKLMAIFDKPFQLFVRWCIDNNNNDVNSSDYMKSFRLKNPSFSIKDEQLQQLLVDFVFFKGKPAVWYKESFDILENCFKITK